MRCIGNFTEGAIDGHGVHSWDDGASFEGDTQAAQSRSHLHKRYILPKKNLCSTAHTLHHRMLLELFSFVAVRTFMNLGGGGGMQNMNNM